MIQWKSWDGRSINYDRLTQQHLSNIHYFMNLVLPQLYPKSLKVAVRNTLMTKYGKILPYHPDHRFDFEKIQLVGLGYLKNNGDIVVDGHKIGWYEEPLIKTNKNK